MYHEWGDGFDFKRLNAAISLIHRLGKWVGLTVWMKEKYGTIRYEYTYFWKFHETSKVLCHLQVLWFKIVLIVTCIRYYDIRLEILDDWMSNYKGVPWYFRPFIKENPWKFS